MRTDFSCISWIHPQTSLCSINLQIEDKPTDLATLYVYRTLLQIPYPGQMLKASGSLKVGYSYLHDCLIITLWWSLTVGHGYSQHQPKSILADTSSCTAQISLSKITVSDFKSNGIYWLLVVLVQYFEQLYSWQNRITNQRSFFCCSSGGHISLYRHYTTHMQATPYTNVAIHCFAKIKSNTPYYHFAIIVAC